MKRTIRGIALLLAVLMLVACTPKTPVEPTEPDLPDAPVEPETPAPQEYRAIAAEGCADGPYLIETVYPTDDVVIANIIATDAPYGADPTGATDSTAAIQAALDACAAQGGGTVFLPVGEYLVSDTIELPVGVFLQGDWQDPDLTDRPAFGTVILAKTPTLEGDEIYDAAAKPLFRILNEGAANNGLVGLTVYYPEQDIASVKPYGYTVYGAAPNMTTLRDLTFINSYRGIGACLEGGSHELLQIESIRMTALSQGYVAYASREVGYASDIRITPRFWMDAGKYTCPDAQALSDYTRTHTVGMELGDLDLNQYTDIFIECCHTAMVMQEGFWGVFYDVVLSECDYGIVVEGIGMHNVLMSNVSIGAAVSAVADYAAGDGTLKLTDLSLTGKGGIACVEGARVTVDNNTDLDTYHAPYATHNKPAPKLYVADVSALDRNKTDAAPAIQDALDRAAATGGVVYIPSGIYSLYSQLTVPAGVELRGAIPTAVRDRSSTSSAIVGTAFISYLSDEAQIVLDERAGVRGVRLFYPANDPLTAKGLLDADDPTTSVSAILGNGAGVYAAGVTLSGCFVGIDFTGCDNHLVNQVMGCAYHTLVRVGGKDGAVNGVLGNQTYLLRQSFIGRGLCDSRYYSASNWGNYANEANAAQLSLLRDQLLRSYTTLVAVTDAQNETLRDCFMFASHHVMTATRAEVVGYNVTSDSHDGDMLVVKEGSRVTTFNALRTTGASHTCDDSSTLDIYGRAVGTSAYEPAYHSSLGVADNAVGEIIDEIEFLNCDKSAGVSGVTLNTDKAYVKEGSGSFKKSTTNNDTVLTAVVNPVDATELADGTRYLHLWLYVSETSGMPFSYGSTVKLASTAGGSGPAYRWILTAHATHDGWNELYLPLDAAWRIGKTDVDDTALQYLQISLAVNANTSYPTVYVDGVTLCSAISYDETAAPLETTAPAPYVSPLSQKPSSATRIMIEDGETTDQLTELCATGVTLNTDPRYVKEGNASLRSAVKNDQYLEIVFPTTNATKYKNGYLHMWVYVEDIAAIKNGGQIELTSGGRSDRGEIAWKTTDYIIDNGWNELYLPLGSTTPTSLDGVIFQISSINYLRIHAPRGTGNAVFYFDDVYLCNEIGATYDASNTALVGGADDYREELPNFNRCENLKGTEKVELNADPAYIKEGDFSFRALTQDQRLIFVCDPVDVSAYSTGYLHLWIYMENPEDISNGQIEISSSGKHDKNELSWRVQDVVTKSGWNELWLRLGSGLATGGDFNPHQLNHLRIYILMKEGAEKTDVYIDDIRFSMTKE